MATTTCLNGSEALRRLREFGDDRLVVLARSDAGVELLLVDPAAPGVSLTFVKSQGRRAALSSVEFADVRVAESDRIGAPGSGWATWDAR